MPIYRKLHGIEAVAKFDEEENDPVEEDNYRTRVK